MDDEAVFGPVLHRLSFGEGIERDLLSDYQVVVVGVDDETYRSYAERGELVTRDGKKITDARTLAGQIGLAKTHSQVRPAPHHLLPRPGQGGAGVQRRDARRDRLDAPARTTRRGAMEQSRLGCDDQRTPRPAAAALPRSCAERARPAQQRPLPRRGGGRAEHRRRGVHRPAPLDDRHRPGAWQGDPQVARQEARDHRPAGVHLRGRGPRPGAGRVRLQARLGRAEGAAGARRGARRGTGRASPSPRRSSRAAAASGEDQAGHARGPGRRPSSSEASMRGSSSRPRRRGSSGSDCCSDSSSARATPCSPGGIARTDSGWAFG